VGALILFESRTHMKHDAPESISLFVLKFFHRGLNSGGLNSGGNISGRLVLGCRAVGDIAAALIAPGAHPSTAFSIGAALR
jgi:hypothetical protein